MTHLASTTKSAPKVLAGYFYPTPRKGGLRGHPIERKIFHAKAIRHRLRRPAIDPLLTVRAPLLNGRYRALPWQQELHVYLAQNLFEIPSEDSA